MISVVIPAHNEGAVIARCLTSILVGAQQGELDIVVVCNGCHDDTAGQARAIDGPITVVETPVASKSHALNLGDESAQSFPRVYVDADVVLTIDSIRRLAVALADGAAAAAPRLRPELGRCSWFVAAYYRVWLATPYHRNGMIGSGVYALSRDGRARFDRFPGITSDDGYVRSLFRADERQCVAEASFTVFPPHRLKDVVRVKTRSQRGAHELCAAYPELSSRVRENPFKPLGWRLLDCRAWPRHAVYLYVAVAAKVRARRSRGSGYRADWERDESSRSL